MAKVILTVKGAAPGHDFAVVLVRKGERYGRKDCLVHDKEDALVEFWDTCYAGKGGFGPLGQFVSRYYRDTLLGRDKWSRVAGWGVLDKTGLCLHSGEPVWSVPAESMVLVLEALRKEG